MATPDVPGANPANGDQLQPGAWAEHQDGSLIRVDDIESGDVIYRMFDMVGEPKMLYENAMSKTDFEKEFGPNNATGVVWTWHDKTAFPWKRVFSQIRPGARMAGASTILSAAQRVADHLGLGRPKPINPSDLQHQEEQIRDIRSALDRIQQAIDRLQT